MELSETIMINLKVMTQLEPYVKLDTSKSLFRAYSTNHYTPSWLRRWWFGSSRIVDMSKVHQLYQNAIELIYTEHHDLDRIKEDLLASVKGIKNLKITYQDDTTISSQLDVILGNIAEICNE